MNHPSRYARLPRLRRSLAGSSRPLAALAALLALAPAAAEARLRVVSSIATLGSLAREVGGERIQVESLAKGYQDPHFVEPKPSLMLVLNRADLVLYVGLDLEIGWLPPLLLGARNPRIQAGEPGNLDCSQAIPLLDLPTTKVDRSMGDVHPQGNPHYWLPPANAKLVARAIAARLTQLDPDGKEAYAGNLASFEGRVGLKEREWVPLLVQLRGTKVATYHKSWSYVSKWLGLVEVGYVEPKPGIPPDPSHLAQLIATLQREGAKLLLVEDFYNLQISRLVAQKAGARLLELPTDVGAVPEVTDWFQLADLVVRRLAGGLDGRDSRKGP
jgi:zinc/manganese transport system substrate-binding protein